MRRPKLTGGRCQCAACGQCFGSERAFDRHRAGEYALRGQWQGSRHCLPLADLLAAGWVRSARGFLLQPDPRRAGAGLQGPSAPSPGMGVAGCIDGRAAA